MEYTATETMIASVPNFAPDMDEHRVDEIPGEKPLTEETPATEAPAPVEQKPEEKIGSDDLINNA